MSERSIVRRLLLPISEYAKVGSDGTLQDALGVLEESRRLVKPGELPHRSVLVERGDGAFTGLLGYRAILGALRPQQKSVTLDNMMRRAGVSEDMVSSSLASLGIFDTDIPNLRDRACSIKISELILARPQTIAVDESLKDLLDIVVSTHDSSMLVVEGGDIVGVLRVSDLLDEVIRASLGEGVGECTED